MILFKSCLNKVKITHFSDCAPKNNINKTFLIRQMLTELLTVIAGILIIVLLAEFIIKISLKVAHHYNWSGTFVGLTILSIGTSIPEIMTHIIGSANILKDPASMNTLSALLVGTNIGSDIFQQNFVLPLIGIIGTIMIAKKNLFIEMGCLIIATMLVWLTAIGGYISRFEGFILVAAYIGYLIYISRKNVSYYHKPIKEKLTFHIGWAILLLLASFLVMAFSADKVLASSEILVKQFNISASFFGIILLGIATALPELTTALMAIIKKKRDISAGILIGSNITNPLFGIGIGALISGYTIPDVIVWYDLPIKIVTAFIILHFLWKRKDLTKKEAILLITVFFLYVLIRQYFFATDF